MKIVFFIYSMSMGGAQRVAANLCNYWSQKEVDVTIITINSLSTDFYILDKKIKRISLEQAKDSKNFFQRVINNVKRVLALRRALKIEKPDIVVSFMDTANVFLIMASIFHCRNTSYVGAERSHPDKSTMSYTFRLLIYICYGRLDAVVALSKKTALWLNANTLANKVAIIPNPVSWPLKINVPIIEIPSSINDKKLLLAVGRLVCVKNFHILINMFNNIKNDFPEWSLVILGEGEERDTLEKQISEQNLKDRVLMLGMAGNVSAWYERADLYVMTSEYEGFPNTLIEAMSYGCPAISFDCDTGPGDIIRHQVDGVLVEPGNIKEFELSLSKLMSNDILRDKYACRAIEVRERFSFSAVASMWDGLFSELMKNRSS